MATDSLATPVPVAECRLGPGIEEYEPDGVDRPYGPVVDLGVQRESELVGGKDVEALVAHERGGAGDRIEGPLDLGPDGLLGSAPTRPRRHWVWLVFAIARRDIRPRRR